MRFTVLWHPDAADELARIWLDATNRQAVTDAANKIDRALASYPNEQGEVFYGDRLLVAAPLAVTFTVRADDRMVQVLQVWHR